MEHLEYIINTLMLCISAAMVMWMAAGFMMLESGSVRSKNVTEILTKNIALYAIASLSYVAIGYRLMYGGAEITGHSYHSDILFQTVFVATSMSIVSGACAERKKLYSFLTFAAIFTAFIYPTVGAWTWGGGWLSNLGFFDFAGAAIVHVSGGAAALAATLLIGPRKGKYTADGKPRPIHGSNMAQVALGTMILWLGWFFFNGGSQLNFTTQADIEAVGKIFLNTNTAAASGVIAAMICSKLWVKRTALNTILNGALAGLVVITADPASPSIWLAMLYGAVAGLGVPFFMALFEKRKIDDPVGAITVHGVAGILGIVLVPIANQSAHIVPQLIGVAAIIGFVFATSFAVWYALKATIGIRVGEEEELAGSDLWEGTGTAYPEFMETPPDDRAKKPTT